MKKNKLKLMFDKVRTSEFIKILLLVLLYTFIDRVQWGGIGFNILSLTIVLFFSIVPYLAFILSVRLFKSEGFFCCLMWVLVMLMPLLGMVSTRSGNLTYKQGGVLLYDNGTVTLSGILYGIMSPFLIVAIYSTFVFIRKYSLKREG